MSSTSERESGFVVTWAKVAPAMFFRLVGGVSRLAIGFAGPLGGPLGTPQSRRWCGVFVSWG